MNPRTPHDPLGSLTSGHTQQAQWIWRNGELTAWEEAVVHVNAVGHASVAAVFEGIKAYVASGGTRLLAFRLDDHLERLATSARICRIDLPYQVKELREAIIALLQANDWREDTYVRPWVFPCGIIREQMVPAGARCEVVIDSWSFTSQLLVPRGCRAAVSTWLRVSETAMPPRVKAFSNYHNGRLAVLEARENGHDWPILLNDRHKVSEGPGACIALVRNGVVITPSLTSGMLESLTRDTVLTLLAEEGLRVEEREVDRSELYLADELFYLGTAWEILPITTVDGLRVGEGKMGPVAAMLEQRYSAITRGTVGDHAEWLTEIPFSKR